MRLTRSNILRMQLSNFLGFWVLLYIPSSFYEARSGRPWAGLIMPEQKGKWWGRLGTTEGTSGCIACKNFKHWHYINAVLSLPCASSKWWTVAHGLLYTPYLITTRCQNPWVYHQIRKINGDFFPSLVSQMLTQSHSVYSFNHT